MTSYTMYVPYTAAVAVLGTDRRIGQQLAAAAVHVGSRPEIEVAALPEKSRQKLDRWWGTYVSGKPPCGYAQVQMTLRHATQNTGRRGREDLHEDFAGLSLLPWWATLEKISGAPSANAAQKIATSAGLRWQEGQGDDGVVEIAAPPVDWPDIFGGAPWPAENFRHMTIRWRWAPWRDRRLRRLAEVDVVSVCRWPIYDARQTAGK